MKSRMQLITSTSHLKFSKLLNRVAACFVKAGVIDGLEWFRAPLLLGGDGRPCIAMLALKRLAHAPKFRRLAVEPLGDDLWERYEALGT